MRITYNYDSLACVASHAASVVLAAIPLIGGAFLWLNSLLIENKLNSVRIDFARLEENVRNEAEALKAAFGDQREEVNSIVQTGLEVRTDEIKRALIASQDRAQWFYVQGQRPSRKRSLRRLEGACVELRRASYDAVWRRGSVRLLRRDAG